MMALEGRSCPECGSKSIQRSRRRGIEWFSPFLGFLSFRCKDCAAIYFIDLVSKNSASGISGLIVNP
jgi:hypothetical protein